MGCIPNLANDIVYSILLKLPVKSLLRFKLTCKSWCSTIDDPEFIKSHLHKSSKDINRQKNLIFFFDEDCDHSIKVLSMEGSISADSKVVLMKQPNIPIFCRNNICYLKVRSCNGLFFINDSFTGIILWNPVIRKYKRIPVPYMLQHMTYFMNYFMRPIYGLAYDFVAEDYKVLCVVLQLPSNTMHPRYVVEIYSVKNQSWKTIQDIFPLPSDLSLYVKDDPVSSNGVIHMMTTSISSKSEQMIISFHLADEKFIVTPVPSKYGDLVKLCAWGDHVYIMTIIDKEISIWSLEKDGKTWNNIMKLPILYGDPHDQWYLGNVTCVKENGNILQWRKNDGRFLEYNVRKNEYNEFKVNKVPLGVKIGPLYVESLVSFKIPWD